VEVGTFEVIIFEHYFLIKFIILQIAPSVVKEVLLPDQLKQQVKEFRKLHAPTVLPYIEQVINSGRFHSLVPVDANLVINFILSRHRVQQITLAMHSY